MLPPPFNGATAHCPHALVHFVCLARKPNLVNFERRETVRRNLKVDLKSMCRTWDFRPGRRRSNHSSNEDSEKDRTWKSKTREAPNSQTSACLECPNEASRNRPRLDCAHIVKGSVRTCFRGSNVHEPSMPPTEPTPDPALEMVHCAPVAPSPRQSSIRTFSMIFIVLELNVTVKLPKCHQIASPYTRTKRR